MICAQSFSGARIEHAIELLSSTVYHFCTHSRKAQFMDAHEARKTAAEMKAFIEQLPPEKIKEIVVRAGIYTPDGKLTKPYRLPSEMHE